MKTSNELRRRAGVLAAVLLVGCATQPPAPPSSANAPEAMLMVFSGRANPTFPLDEASAAKLAELLASTRADPSFEGETVIPSVLGYQGVAVRSPGGGTLPAWLAVNGEHVEVRDDGGTTSFRLDPGRDVEQLLLDQAVAHRVIDRDRLAELRR